MSAMDDALEKSGRPQRRQSSDDITDHTVSLSRSDRETGFELPSNLDLMGVTSPAQAMRQAQHVMRQAGAVNRSTMVAAKADAQLSLRQKIVEAIQSPDRTSVFSMCELSRASARLRDILMKEIEGAVRMGLLEYSQDVREMSVHIYITDNGMEMWESHQLKNRNREKFEEIISEGDNVFSPRRAIQLEDEDDD